MAGYPIVKNTAFSFPIPGLISQADTKLLITNPTIAAGDFKVSIDGGAFNNPATLPDVLPVGSTQVRIQLSAAEMNGDMISIKWEDAAGAEWCSGWALIQTAAGQIDANVTSRLAPTVAGRTVDVAATGEVGLDFDNIKDATGAHTLTNITVPTVTTVTNAITVGGYSAGQDPATFVLATPANKLATDASGRITLVPSQIVVKKNQALSRFMFVMNSSVTHNPTTGLTVTARRSIDGAAFAAAANAVVEVSNGWYYIDMAAADLNGNIIAWRMTAVGADDCDFTIVTQP